MKPKSNDGEASGQVETPLPDGFRRTTRLDGAVSPARVRARLAQAARGAPATARAGLAFLRSWESSSALAGTLWFADVLRDSAGARRALSRRLRILGTPRGLWRQAAPRAVGSPARIAGVALAAASSSRASHIWSNSEVRTGNVRLLIEEGHDFFLRDEAGEIARIVAAGGTLLGVEPLRHGDAIDVLGFVDWVTSPDTAIATLAPRHPRAEPLGLALRSADELPLIVIKS